MNILHIDASASDAATSHSRRLSAELVEKLKVANPGASVVYRDVTVDRLPHVDLTIRQAWMPDGEKDASLAATATRSRALRGLPQPPLLECVRRIARNVQRDIIAEAAHIYAHDRPETTAERLHSAPFCFSSMT